MDRVRSHLRDTIDMEPAHEVIRRTLLSDPSTEGRPIFRMGLQPMVLAQAKTLALYLGDPTCRTRRSMTTRSARHVCKTETDR